MLGMTLADYAKACGTSPQAARREYLESLRFGAGVELPPVTRHETEGLTVKFCLAAGARAGAPLETESVIIPMHSYRGAKWYTLCLSSQVGCRMGCTFCETGRMGWVRNLTAAEIVAQRLVARRFMLDRAPVDRRPYSYARDGIQNIVFMGMGEPLDNVDNVVQAIRVLNEPNGLAFPLSQITISTVGRVDGIRRLADLVRASRGMPAGREPQWSNLRLAVSLTAPNDALRNQLVPINRGMPLAELQRVLLDYPLPRRGLFLIEYVLIKGVNDAPEHADQVAAWCRPLPCVVNLIPYNPQRHAPYATPSEATLYAFLRRLRAQGIFVKRRIPQGRDVMAACGQLGNSTLRALRGAVEQLPATVRHDGRRTP